MDSFSFQHISLFLFTVFFKDKVLILKDAIASLFHPPPLLLIIITKESLLKPTKPLHLFKYQLFSLFVFSIKVHFKFFGRSCINYMLLKLFIICLPLKKPNEIIYTKGIPYVPLSFPFYMLIHILQILSSTIV